MTRKNLSIIYFEPTNNLRVIEIVAFTAAWAHLSLVTLYFRPLSPDNFSLPQYCSLVARPCYLSPLRPLCVSLPVRKRAFSKSTISIVLVTNAR